MNAIDVMRYFRHVAPQVAIGVEREDCRYDTELGFLSEKVEELSQPSQQESPHSPPASRHRLTVWTNVVASGRLFTGRACLRSALLDDESEPLGPLSEILASMIRLNLIRIRWEVGTEVDDSLVCGQLDRLIGLLGDSDRLRQEVEVWKQTSQPEA